MKKQRPHDGKPVLANNQPPKEALQMKFFEMDAHRNTCYFVVMNARGKVIAKRRLDTNEKLTGVFIDGPEKFTCCCMNEAERGDRHF